MGVPFPTDKCLSNWGSNLLSQKNSEAIKWERGETSKSKRKLSTSLEYSTAVRSKKSLEKNLGNCYLSSLATGASQMDLESAPA